MYYGIISYVLYDQYVYNDRVGVLGIYYMYLSQDGSLVRLYMILLFCFVWEGGYWLQVYGQVPIQVGQ